MATQRTAHQPPASHIPNRPVRRLVALLGLIGGAVLAALLLGGSPAAADPASDGLLGLLPEPARVVHEVTAPVRRVVSGDRPAAGGPGRAAAPSRPTGTARDTSRTAGRAQARVAPQRESLAKGPVRNLLRHAAKPAAGATPARTLTGVVRSGLASSGLRPSGPAPSDAAPSGLLPAGLLPSVSRPSRLVPSALLPRELLDLVPSLLPATDLLPPVVLPPGLLPPVALPPALLPCGHVPTVVVMPGLSAVPPATNLGFSPTHTAPALLTAGARALGRSMATIAATTDPAGGADPAGDPGPAPVSPAVPAPAQARDAAGPLLLAGLPADAGRLTGTAHDGVLPARTTAPRGIAQRTASRPG